MKHLFFIIIIFLSLQSLGQGPTGWKLDKMPVDLETDFALSSLPPHIRKDATVYLLDPEKGYYVGRQGTNGFICFLNRTEWVTDDYRQDLSSAISYDAEGARTIFPSWADAAALRATGKYTAAQLKDTMNARFARGYYKAPAKSGLSYMLAPVMRTYIGDGANKHVQSFSMPHYMFYAPYLTAADIGGNSTDGGPMILGDPNDPHAYIIMPAGQMERAKMNEANAALLKRLIAYRSYFDPGHAEMHH